MPVTSPYPGVHVEEVPSGVRTIAGVSTSVGAFIGTAARGRVAEPVRVTSFADYERKFGGLWAPGTMGYAVRDFYTNGGSQALIVRISDGGDPSTIQLAGANGALDLVASNVGEWSDGTLIATVDHATRDPNDDTLFNLEIEFEGAVQERHLNVSVDENDRRYVIRVLEESSSFVRVALDQNDDPLVGGTRPDEASVTAAGGVEGSAPGLATYQGGLDALAKAELFNLLCIPPAERGGDTDPAVYQAALAFLVNEARRAMLLVDPPAAWGANPNTAADDFPNKLAALGLSGDSAQHAALYYPRLRQADPLRDGQIDTFVPCGALAGIMARTDATRGVWKAPAGLDASLRGIQGLQVNLTDQENAVLNPLAVNCLRAFPIHGRVAWGARTMRGADALGHEYKYIPVRRLANYVEESLFRGTQWVVFEPNDEPLWAQIRLNVGAFMQNLFRQGAFQGGSPRDAYFVKCDKETTTQNDIDLGIVNILVGFAPLKPAEFVVIKIQQIAGNIQS